MQGPDAPSDVEFQQGDPGVDEQLGQGEATELNEGLELARDAGLEEEEGVEVEEPDLTPEEEGELMAGPQDFEPQFSPTDDDQKWITGPTSRPHEAQTAGIRSKRGPTSDRVRRNLPALQKAAAEPGASAQLKSLVRFLIEKA